MDGLIGREIIHMHIGSAADWKTAGNNWTESIIQFLMKSNDTLRHETWDMRQDQTKRKEEG